jgi:glutamyl-tRNA reductase
MSVLVVGMSHRSAPVEVLERAAVGADEIPKLLDEMLHGSHVTEVMMLSTCNRIEVYAVVDAFHGGLADVSGVLGRHAALPLPELTEHLYVHYAGSAVQHLFAVAAGLDSMVIGEAQILGQLRAAYAAADTAGTVGRTLHELSQQALRVGKRVHHSTGIDAAGASIVSEALAAATEALGRGLEDVRAVVVGAGAMGALAAAHLRRAHAAEVVVLNRSADRAQRLVENTRRTGTPARSAPLETLADELTTADLLVACTGAVGTVVALETMAAAVVARDGRPLAVCDLGLPRDVDPAVAALPGVTVVDLVTLQARLAPRAHGAAVATAQELVAEEAQAYLASQRSAEVTPTVTALRRRASEVIDAELLRLDSRLPDLDGDVREEFVRSVRRVVDKLLHTPTVQVKRLAEGPDGSSYAHALRELFELDPQTPAAVAVQRHGDVLAALEAPMGAALEAPMSAMPAAPVQTVARHGDDEGDRW